MAFLIHWLHVGKHISKKMHILIQSCLFSCNHLDYEKANDIQHMVQLIKSWFQDTISSSSSLVNIATILFTNNSIDKLTTKQSQLLRDVLSFRSRVL